MTAQFPDRLLFNGEELKLLGEPFTDWLETNFDGAFCRGEFGYGLFVFQTTASKRGYTATWKIEGDRLFLVKINGQLEATGQPATLSDFFPEAVGAVFADWFTGTLRLAGGACTEYVHGGWRSRYEREIFVSITCGVVIEVETDRNDRV